MSEEGVMDAVHLPEEIRQGISVSASSSRQNLPLDDRINLMEKEMIISALKETSGVQVKAAGILGINQRSLWHRIKKHEIDVDMFKNLQ